jgi:two-component system response regulator GlrR
MLTKTDLLRRLSDRIVSEQPGPTVLVVDDDTAITRLCQLTLERAGFRVETSNDSREALERIEGNDYAAILLDLQMPYMHGATLLALIGRDKPDVLQRLIVMTALPEAALADFRGRVAAVLCKPLKDGEILQHVRQCIDPNAVVQEAGDVTSAAHVRV